MSPCKDDSFPDDLGCCVSKCQSAYSRCSVQGLRLCVTIYLDRPSPAASSSLPVPSLSAALPRYCLRSLLPSRPVSSEHYLGSFLLPLIAGCPARAFSLVDRAVEQRTSSGFTLRSPSRLAFLLSFFVTFDYYRTEVPRIFSNVTLLTSRIILKVPIFSTLDNL